MADVVFNGTTNRKPMGMAEVNLTFADAKEVLQTGKLAGFDTNYDEVTITRRLFRDGTSEYYVNKAPCRLKDVQSLFMDTGIGRSSYSIMEQGKIDKVLSSHPEDRRSIFEEAAGITKFKFQKRDALRKLEYTDANLLRVSDVIREVKRQISSLQRQASKARRYQALTAELKHLDVQLARHEFEVLQSEIQTIEKRAGELKTQIEDVRLEIASSEGNVTNLREQAAATENRRQQTLQRQRDLQSEIERLDLRSRTNSDRIQETQASIQTAEKEASEARTQWTDSNQKLEATRAALVESEARLRQQTADLEEVQKSLDDAVAAVGRHENAIQELQSALLNLEGVLANLRNQVAALDKQRQEIDARKQKLAADRNGVADEKQKMVQKVESFQAEIQSFKQTCDDSRNAMNGGEASLREAEAQCQLLTGRIMEEQKTLSEKRSRQEVLRQLQESYEGYSDGNQALMRWMQEPATAESPRPSTDKILGTLANLIDVEPRFAAAIETALGRALQAIVVSDADCVVQLFHRLHSGDWGQATLALNNGNLHAPEPLPPPPAPLAGSIDWANKVVKPRPQVATLVTKLLADTLVVPDLDTALNLHRQSPSLTYVTLTGDLMDGCGVLTAGSRKATNVQLIGRRNEISSLGEDVARHEASLQQLSASKGEWEGRLTIARQSLGDRQSELRLQESDLGKKEGLLATMRSELQGLENRLSAVAWEIEDLDKQRAENEASHARLAQELTDAQKRQGETQQQLDTARREAGEAASRRAVHAERVQEIRVAKATAEEQIRSQSSQAAALEEQMRHLQEMITTRENDCRAGRQRIVQWEGENAQAAQQVKGVQQEKDSLAQTIATIEAEKARIEAEIHSTVETLRGHRDRIDKMQEELTESEVKIAERRGDSTHLSERIIREYTTDLAIVKLLPLQPPPEVEPSAVENETAPAGDELPPESEAADGEGGESKSRFKLIPISDAMLPFADWDAVALRIEALRARIQSMGAVNLEAVQEYEDLEQRHTFLTREFNDLTVSKEQLLQIIQRINETTRKMFHETFEKIRHNFQTTFTDLFGGGSADLLLLDEQDLLECGIEIVARPPGKRLQSISLLSGGEKTLTAVSLLFAIYMVKPSPFCVLDELDAPLDESNIERFVRMLKRFLEHSQFVLITHNKKTIAMADGIYGVTMEEHGVSKVLSMKFAQRAAKHAPGAFKSETPADSASNGSVIEVSAETHAPVPSVAEVLAPASPDIAQS
jgi:chromosome segregation protein